MARVDIPAKLLDAHDYLLLDICVDSGLLAFGFASSAIDGIYAERFMSAQQPYRSVVALPEGPGSWSLVFRSGPTLVPTVGRVQQIRPEESVSHDLYAWQRGRCRFGRELSRISANEWIDILRTKWEEIPVTAQGRLDSTQLMSLDDDKLMAVFEDARRTTSQSPSGYSIRGWYQELYARGLNGLRVIEIGPGIGVDTMFLAAAGAEVVSIDVASSNLELIERISRILGVQKNIRTVQLETLDSLDGLPNDFDMVWAIGSLLTVPFNIAQLESEAVLRLVRPGGRWVELAYPRLRWEREGRLPFDVWGDRTDGFGTPWMEWYDREKILLRLESRKPQVLLDMEFHEADFIWFDLKLS